MKKVLIIAAHPDDEILGVGATARKHVECGDEVYAVILGEGQTSRWENRDDADMNAVKELHKDSYESAKIIGMKGIYFENFPDNRFDQVDLLDVVKCVEKYVDEIQPDIIYTHFSGDLNIDHRITNQAVLTATRPIGQYSVKEVYGFETLSSTEWNFGSDAKSFKPQKFVDVTPYFQKKVEAMSKYKSELCEYPHPRSLRILETLAELRGSVISVERAEAFEVIRIVE